MTYLELVNNALRRLRETEVSSVPQTSYSTMVGDFIKRKKPYLHRGRFPDRYEAVGGATEREQQQAKANRLQNTIQFIVPQLSLYDSNLAHRFVIDSSFALRFAQRAT